MPVNVIGTLKPKNNGKFPVAEAVDIKVTDDLRLDKALENKADLQTVNFALDQKAEKTSTENLQAQINELITPVTEDAEVQNARVGADGKSYATLKARLDAENNNINNDFNSVTNHKNIMPKGNGSITLGTTVDITYSNGNFSCSGTATTQGGRLVHLLDFSLPAGTYTVSAHNITYSGDEPRMYLTNSSNNNIIAVFDKPTADPKTFTINTATNVFVGVNIDNESEYDYTCNLQLEEGSTKTDYLPPTGTAVDLVARKLCEENEDAINSRPFVTPQMYGAYGDGSHDDTAAIQSAINSGKRVIIPNGTYLISAPLNISKQGITIEGENDVAWNNGRCALFLMKSGTASLNSFFVIGENSQNFSLKNLLIRGDENHTPNYGILFDAGENLWTSDIMFENVFVEYCKNGIYLNKVFKSVFKNVRVSNCTNIGIHLTGKVAWSGAISGTTLTLINCYCNNCNKSFMLERITYSTLLNCASDGATTYDYGGNFIWGVSFICCGSERSHGNIFYFVGYNYGVNIQGQNIVNMQPLTEGLDNAEIAYSSLANSSISNFYYNGARRTYSLYKYWNVGQGDNNITILDSSISPDECNTAVTDGLQFLRNTIVYSIENTPDFPGQIAVTDSGIYIANLDSEWTSLQ